MHAIVLIVGGSYTYARVPLGFHLQEWLDLERNPYDRFGHFMQGFVRALAAREILFRVICVVIFLQCQFAWTCAVL
jgi:putative membrane protein